MILNLLDIVSSSDGVFAPRPAAVDVAKLLHDVEQLMAPVAESLRHPIDVAIAGDMPALQADPELLRRVLQNLVDNALRHSPPGSPVQLEAEAENGVMRFHVRDRDPGVPAALREGIVDKYVRVARASEVWAAGGKGLGLAFCRLAVEAHGGPIWVEDNQPQGSMFTVQISLG